MSSARPSSNPTTRRRWTAPLVVVAVFLLLLGLSVRAGMRLDRVASFERPDRRYCVVVLRKHIVWPRHPGQASDSPGVVRLVDGAGRVLHEAPLDMVQLVENVDWQDHRVVVRPVADWPLPD